MELETEDQINIDYNYFFYATMCHVCKRFGDDVPLSTCSGCKMISYCGKEHQKQHWAQHKTLCKIIQKVLRDKHMETHNITWQERNEMKQDLMQTMSDNLKRPLEYYEKQMFKFPRECVICFEQNVKSLVDCRNCAISFCKDHENDIRHKDFCAPLELYLRINFTTFLEGIIPEQDLLLVPNSKPFHNMKDFLNMHAVIEPCSEISNDIMLAKHSEYLTRPLTLFRAMQILNYPTITKKRKELVIHVMAVDFFEEVTVSGWELLLHLIETVSLTIIIIGTKLKYESHSLPICDDCLSRGNKASLEFHSVLYESYVCSPLFVKPDLIVGFNGIGEYNFETNPKMREFMQMLAKQNCPVLLTSYRQQEIEEYINNINITLDRKVDYLYNGKNAFASLRPFRSVGPEQVFFQNNFMVVYRSLCS